MKRLVPQRAFAAVFAATLSAGALLAPMPATANDAVLPPECTPTQVCTADNFKVKLHRIYTTMNYDIEPKQKTITFVYFVCPGRETQQPCFGTPDKGLSNVRVDLPDGCLDDTSVFIDTDTTILNDCEIVEADNPINDPSSPNYCAIDGVALGKQVKCNVTEAAGDWGKNGELCTPIKITYPYSVYQSGEMGLGLGIAAVGTKAGPDCQAEEIVGPVCGNNVSACTPVTWKK
jgi:hypothetical protein